MLSIGKTCRQFSKLWSSLEFLLQRPRAIFGTQKCLENYPDGAGLGAVVRRSPSPTRCCIVARVQRLENG